MSASTVDVPGFFETLTPYIEAELEGRLAIPGAPPRLLRAMRYSVLSGGKRLRPVMVLLACRMAGESVERALPAASALEMIHAYSLIHDDLPSMDDDDMRRGRPTTHRAFGEAEAILAGDALQALAFEALADVDVEPAARVQMVRILARAAGASGMVGGQVLDIEGEAETAGDLDVMHGKKTGALFRAAVLLGGLCGGADDDLLGSLTQYADAFGLVFQISDDLLDVVGDPDKTGRYRGSDAERARRTYPGVVGVDASRKRMDTTVKEGLKALSQHGSAGDELRSLLVFASGRQG